MSNSSAIHEAVQRLNSELEDADLLLLKSKPKFLSKKTHDDQDWPTSHDGPDALLPATLAANVEFQKASGSTLLVSRVSQDALLPSFRSSYGISSSGISNKLQRRSMLSRS